MERYTDLPKAPVTTSHQSNDSNVQLALSPSLRISLNNYNAPDVVMPCSLNHEDYEDFSNIALKPGQPNEDIQGFWRGTCQALSGQGTGTCTVMAFRRGMHTFLYSCCLMTVLQTCAGRRRLHWHVIAAHHVYRMR